MSRDNARITPDGGRESAREGPPEIADADAPNTSGAGTDAARGQSGEMARHGGDPLVDNTKTRSAEPATSSQGSRTGSLLGSQSERTGMGDGTPKGSSQGLANDSTRGGDKPRP